jgi:hypothetical protein
VSIKEEAISIFSKKLQTLGNGGEDLIDWVIALIERSSKKEIHIFSLDFASALLANILHASGT